MKTKSEQFVYTNRVIPFRCAAERRYAVDNYPDNLIYFSKNAYGVCT